MSERSETGFPEGCSLSVIALTCMAYLAHEVLSTDGTCLSFLLITGHLCIQTIEGCKLAYQSLGRLRNAFKLQLSPDWVWATAPEFRKRLQHVSYDGVRVPLMWHAKDLGVDVNYSTCCVDKKNCLEVAISQNENIHD